MLKRVWKTHIESLQSTFPGIRMGRRRTSRSIGEVSEDWKSFWMLLCGEYQTVEDRDGNWICESIKQDRVVDHDKVWTAHEWDCVQVWKLRYLPVHRKWPQWILWYECQSSGQGIYSGKWKIERLLQNNTCWWKKPKILIWRLFWTHIHILSLHGQN